MLYPPVALERAMTIREVVLRAMSGEITWIQAAEIIGCTPRSVRRWRGRFARDGYFGLLDRRRGRPSPRRAPFAEVQRFLRLYREQYAGFNARHFYQIARREHGVTLSYTYVKTALQKAGLLPKHRARGRHRRRREPRPCWGELVHLDGSRHRWLALVPEQWQTLIVAVDDATKRVLYAHLVEGGESLGAIMTALRVILEQHGIPGALYTDRASWAVYTPTSGTAPDRAKVTQVGRALARLGIEHIVSFSPQARGRSERMNRTLQGRLVNELRVAQIRTLEAANRYLRQRFVPTLNATLAAPRPIRPPPSCPSAGWTSSRSSVMKRPARSRGTTPSSWIAWSCRSTSSGAAAAVRACPCSSGVISMAGTPSGGDRVAWAGTPPPGARLSRAPPDRPFH